MNQIINKIKNFLPSRKITALIIVPFLAILFFLLLKEINFDNAKELNLEQKLLANLQKDINIDTDGDGLMDWEERLHKTDIKLEDTDGDGLSDAFEVATGTDPLDFLNMKSKEEDYEREQKQAKELKIKHKDLNITEKIGQALLARTMQLRESGLIYNKSAKENTADLILEKAQLHFNNKFTVSDLNISETLTKEEFRINFTLTGDKIRLAVSGIKLQSELELLLAYFKTEDVHYLKQIKRNLELMQKIIDEYAILEIPVDFSDTYLDYLNLNKNIIDILEIFSNADVDPVGAISALTIYDNILIEISKTSDEFSLYFSE